MVLLGNILILEVAQNLNNSLEAVFGKLLVLDQAAVQRVEEEGDAWLFAWRVGSCFGDAIERQLVV